MKLKYLFIAMLFFGIHGAANAQFQKGDLMIGGSVGVSNEASFQVGNLTGKSFAVNFSPSFGYFISESSAIGVSPGFSFNTRQSYQQGERYGDRINNLSGSISLFYRKYFKLADQFYFFFEPVARYNTSLIEDLDRRDFLLEVSPGVAYRISDKWMVDTSFGGIRYNYSFSQTGESTDSEFNNWSLNLSNFGWIRLIFIIQSNK